MGNQRSKSSNGIGLYEFAHISVCKKIYSHRSYVVDNHDENDESPCVYIPSPQVLNEKTARLRLLEMKAMVE